MTPPEAPAPNRLDRLLAAIPLAAILLWLALAQLFEVVGRKTPTIFTDELEWTQISRSIADTGHPARRGVPIFFKTLYVYVLAPVWWIHDTATAYDAAKYLNVVVMCSAAIPAYLLARRYVSKPAALAVAAATISTPAMAYESYLVPEVAAYPWSVLCAYLVVRSLAGGGTRWTAAAAIACLIAPLVRLQLVMLPVAFASAAFALWYATPRARALRARWTLADTIGAWLLAVGAFIVFNRAILHHSNEWAVTTEFWRGRILQHSLWATGALTIGVGVLPLTATVAFLFPARSEREGRAERALVAFVAAAVVAFVLYAGLKGAYLSTVFSTLVVERNMIYVAPLLFLATAVVLERRRIRLAPLAAGVALTVFLMAYLPIQLGFPYYEALGFSILALGNRELYLPQSTLQDWAIGIAAIAALILLAKWLAERRGVGRTAVRSVLAVVALLVIAWNLTGQVYAARGANDASEAFIEHFPSPPNWVDKATGGAAVTYLGQQIADPNGIHLLEFWNRSVQNVWSLDGTAPGPGPTLSPDLERPDGTLHPRPRTPYALTDNGVQFAQKPVLTFENLRLYRLNGTWRLRAYQEGISSDGWMSLTSSYTRFQGAAHGTLVVSLSRSAFCPRPEHAPPAGRVTVRFGDIAVNANRQPVIAKGKRTFHLRIPNCQERELRIPVGRPPWRAETTVTPLFRPSNYGISDGRSLGAIITYVYQPD